MSQIAHVIVDVPTMQTNQAYSYAVPENLQNIVAIGGRVIVPFGHRKVQGFIIELSDEILMDTSLKTIESVMDPEPVLTEELVQLGRQMATDTYSFLISCYLTMLPASLRAHYKKWIIPTTHDLKQLPEIFNEYGRISWEQVEQQHLEQQILKLKENQYVRFEYEVTDSITKKTADYFELIMDAHQLKQEQKKLTKRAFRQQQLLEILLKKEKGEQLSVNDLRDQEGISRHVIEAAVAKGWGIIETVEVLRDPYQHKKIEPSSPLNLNNEQKKAYDRIIKAMDKNCADTFLLEGVTGSGKTEIYLQAIAQALDAGKGALMLVPEIALTPQMAYRFKSRFGDQIAVMHSALSEGEKYDEWRRIKTGKARVVVGARSSVFAPLKNIGLIVMDEEHEGTYKQEEHPRYHTRDVALWRAAYHHCPVILGSATPSLESRARASKGVFKHLLLTKRATNMPLPKVEIVDMREEMKEGNFTIFSRALAQQLNRTLANNEQAVLFLNRRGYANFVMCRDCGDMMQCPNCDISLTHHLHDNKLKCHYCGFEMPLPTQCPHCGGHHIGYFGTGTQKVEQQLQQFLPHAKILRMDVDTTRKKGAHDDLLEKFGNHEADILLGTQMIAKGLDFPNVTFVGVLNADTALGIPDFRSAEKTFQLLMQVSGRAGRGKIPGSVVIQTYNPDHYAIQLAKEQNYEQFYLHEMHFRHLGHYSPYYFMAKIEVSHKEEAVTAKKAQELAEYLRKQLSQQSIILGPSPRSIARVNNLYYFQVIIKYKAEPKLKEALLHILESSQKEYAKGLRVMIDNHPLNFM
ncbi:primosomal protein N' [Allofustis seminis]|uniref:primosomal protein N' n=1 Tax=Allofustis seminis TaxID=166939 RepID=UPI00037938C9|nr:primosomal protein N' [Allofustis seminis]